MRDERGRFTAPNDRSAQVIPDLNPVPVLPPEPLPMRVLEPPAELRAAVQAQTEAAKPRRALDPKGLLHAALGTVAVGVGFVLDHPGPASDLLQAIGVSAAATATIAKIAGALAVLRAAATQPRRATDGPSSS
jgi:hypothetical protein